MSDSVIKVEDVGKLYKLGEIGTGTISHDLNRWFARVRGKEDPFGKVGVTNDRTAKGSNDWVWALKDINFEVKQGEVLGIIGRNGAGKSTLLKILSKVTTPSTGRIKVKGRIASLLEVGTGFHQELTGRENVFLNGAILGMKKAEIRSKFDEIVDFAGVEKYIDTPVKRYSSGMYVRLAFAVAAFLEPEILIIDEVLAVGDAEFQKKCLGRMKDVSSNDGRTILFVSHQLGVVSQLCKSSILLKNGRISMVGPTKDILSSYLLSNDLDSNTYFANNSKFNQAAFFETVQTLGESNDKKESFQFDESVLLGVTINFNEVAPTAKVSITLQNNIGDYLSTILLNLEDINVKEGKTSFKVKFPRSVIAPNTYAFRLAVFVPNGVVYDLIEMVCPISIHDSGSELALFEGVNYGSFFMNYELMK